MAKRVTPPERPEVVGERRMTGPEGLRLLADWFDVTRPGEDDEVQRDLRRWATDMETAAKELAVLRAERDANLAALDAGRRAWTTGNA